MPSERRFPATFRKRLQSRLRGDVAKSSSLTAGSSLCAGLAVSLLFLELFQNLIEVFQKTFALGQDFHSNHVLLSVTTAAAVVGKLIVVPLAAAGLVGMWVEVCQVGLYLLPSQLFRLNRLSLVQGLRRILGLRDTPAGGLAPSGIPAELFKLLAYLLALTLVFVGVVCTCISELLYFEFRTAGQVVSVTGRLLKRVLSLGCGVWLILGLAELLLARRRREQRLRMSREEFEKETRESEGDPHLVGLRRQMHQELALHTAVEQVRHAKAVVVN